MRESSSCLIWLEVPNISTNFTLLLSWKLSHSNFPKRRRNHRVRLLSFVRLVFNLFWNLLSQRHYHCCCWAQIWPAGALSWSCLAFVPWDTEVASSSFQRNQFCNHSNTKTLPNKANVVPKKVESSDTINFPVWGSRDSCLLFFSREYQLAIIDGFSKKITSFLANLSMCSK